MYHQFMELADVDITKQPMEIGPTAHYMMGGIRVDPDTAMSTVPGLFAAGEAAAGLHGANRLGGNSLSDLVVFGRRAGGAAAEYAKSVAASPRVADDQVEEATRAMLEPFERTSGESPFEVHQALQECMDRHLGIFRVAEDLEQGVAVLRQIRERAGRVRVEGTRPYNPGWHLAWDLRNMITISEARIRSALLRKQSRGAHSRLDYPHMDSQLSKVNTCVTRSGSEMKIGTTALPEMPADLKALFEATAPAPQPVKENVG
jgi:succinate dehydrogenase / fumarate reductase flavoprotein subunit